MVEPSGVDVLADRRLKDPLLKADLSAETYTGATNAAAALGNGRLTVGISPWGELTYFRWPRPSFYDHLRYFTFANLQNVVGLLSSIIRRPRAVRMGEDAPSRDFQRHGRPYEPCPKLGSRAGLMIGPGIVSWMGESTWSADRSYITDTSPVLETRLIQRSAELKVQDWVDPDLDLMVRDFKTGPNAGLFFYHGTFQPSTTHPTSRHIFHSILPDPKDSGFAAVYLPDDDLVVHFRPSNSPRSEEVHSALEDKCSHEVLDTTFPEGGVFLAWGFTEESDSVQVGADRAGRRIKADAPIGGRDDAQDGQLEGSTAFVGPVDASLSREISSDGDRVTVLISVAKTAGEAVDIVREARERGPEDLRDRVEEWWQQISDKIYTPAEADRVTARVIRRSLMNLFIGQDKESGAIVASPARQPPYHFDWPRDGAFFDLALDLAGFPETVDRHLKFYAETQRRGRIDANPLWVLGFRSPLYRPKGHWYSNITSDGEPGTVRVIPVEIDETALVVWDLWRHEKFVPKERREEYRLTFRPTLERATDALVEYVDVDKGWVRKAFEDDNWKPTATLHGATSVLTGLCSAVDAGERWNVRGMKVISWRKAARSLRMGTLQSIVSGRVLDDPGWRGLSWSIWPAPLFDLPQDPRADELVGASGAGGPRENPRKKARICILGRAIVGSRSGPPRQSRKAGFFGKGPEGTHSQSSRTWY